MATTFGGFEALNFELRGAPYLLVAREREHELLASRGFERVETPSLGLYSLFMDALDSPGGAFQVAQVLERALPHSGAGRPELASQLLDLVETGRAVLLRDTRPRTPALSAELVEEAPSLERPSPIESLQDWIELRIDDEAGQPVANVRYELTLPDGSKRRGQSDRNGIIRHEHIASGQCTVTLLDHDRQVWELS